MASKKDKMDALKKLKGKDKSDEEMSDETTEDEGTEDEGMSKEDDSLEAPEIDVGEADDPEAAGGEPGGAEEGVDTPGADMAEGMSPEADEMGTAGSVIAETLGVSPEAGRSLYDAAMSIPKYSGMSEDEIADLLDRDINVRMAVEMKAAKDATGGPGPEDAGMGGDMGAPMDEMGAGMDTMGGGPGGMGL